MEMLPCSNIRFVGQPDCPQQNARTTPVHGESNCLEQEKQVQVIDYTVESLLPNVKEPQLGSQGEVKGAVHELHTSEGCPIGASSMDCRGESQKLSSSSHNSDSFDDDRVNTKNYSEEPSLVSENDDLKLDSIENGHSYNKEGESSHTDSTWLECHESVPLWVKWRGNWHAGIRCARADWPLSTLRAKPTHGRKKYSVIFFPHTRNYSWADMLLVRSIDEIPQPIAYKTHNAGLRMVDDLSVARRFIMQKLAVGMLNIVDQFHTEALIETARNVVVWKEFPMEASRCNGYSDLGKLLLKLQNMILRSYINHNWLQNSYHSWVHRCQNACSAETVELLKEELVESILWNEVQSLRNAALQPTLGSEWRTWKHEVMKWFSTSHPVCSGGEFPQHSSDAPVSSSLQISRKRPKLEVRQAEAHVSHEESIGSEEAIVIETEIDSEFFNNRVAVNDATLAPEIDTKIKMKDVAAETGDGGVADVCDKAVVATANSVFTQIKDVELTPVNVFSGVNSNMKDVSTVAGNGGVADVCDNVVVATADSVFTQIKDVEMTPVNGVSAVNSSVSGAKSQRCSAYVEAKGRQCVRSANDGDVYCCVHLLSRCTGSSTKSAGSHPMDSLDTPPCEGTTVLGTKCKHRSLHGSSFCKKHRPKNEAETITNTPENGLKRKYEENVPSLDTMNGRKMVSVEDVGAPLDLDPVRIIAGSGFNGRDNLFEKSELSAKPNNVTEDFRCIGSGLEDNGNPCLESPKKNSLYCEKHLPSWLKRARNGTSRIISKEIFVDLLNHCHSHEQKLHIHNACEIFYKLFNSILSVRNPVSKDVQLQWALSEASKNLVVGEIFTKLVCSEKERLVRLWGFTTDENTHEDACGLNSSVAEPALLTWIDEGDHDDETIIKCKICSEEFMDDQALGVHWMDSHEKEAQWLFRGYACSICLDSFTNKKILETHVNERHCVQFVEQCMLLQCIPCGSHFGNNEELWSHVLVVHPHDFRPSKAVQHTISADDGSPGKSELYNSASVANASQNLDNVRKFVCDFCGLKFNLLPDLGCHHQASHMGPGLFSSWPSKRGIRYYAYRLKSGRVSRPKMKKSLAAASYRIRNRANATIKKHIQTSKPLTSIGTDVQSHLTEAVSLGRLSDSHCSDVSRILFSEMQKTKRRPNNLDILSVARSACCKISLEVLLQGKYGILPHRLYLKAAKLCSEHDIKVSWHQEGFICPKGCRDFNALLPFPLIPRPIGTMEHRPQPLSDSLEENWDVDESHYVVGSNHLSRRLQKARILCVDISFGQETMPLVCVADEGLLDSLSANEDCPTHQIVGHSMPWESFTYTGRPLLDQSPGPDTESLELRCSCPLSMCYPEACDHVYLFDSDYDDAKDIFGKPMNGRFPYDDRGRIILEEGYLVYECNQMCSCGRTCPNRVLQNGVTVKLEVFKTEHKGWGVRAGETILRGTFICEYIGEVLDENEANKRRNRYEKDGCGYLYEIGAHIDDMSRLIEGQAKIFIDSTNYGNVSRFINHSCSPNLVNYQVLMESMSSEHAHVGLYANQDIAFGEELTYDYWYRLLPGEGCPCLCGAPRCRGRLF